MFQDLSLSWFLLWFEINISSVCIGQRYLTSSKILQADTEVGRRDENNTNQQGFFFWLFKLMWLDRLIEISGPTREIFTYRSNRKAAGLPYRYHRFLPHTSHRDRTSSSRSPHWAAHCSSILHMHPPRSGRTNETLALRMKKKVKLTAHALLFISFASFVLFFACDWVIDGFK